VPAIAHTKQQQGARIMASGTITVSTTGTYSTLQEGVNAAAAAGDRMVVVDPGTYSGNLALTSADNGITVWGEAGSGTSIDTGTVNVTGASNVTIDRLSFDGTGSGTSVYALNSTDIELRADRFNDVGQAVQFDGTTKSMLWGNQVEGATGAAFELFDGASNDTVYDNIINKDQVVGTTGAIYAHGANSLTIDHNLIQNTSGAAISLMDFYGPGDTATENQNAVVSNNNILNADTSSASTDSGAIYVLGRSQVETGDTITMNFVSGGGSPGAHAVGLYLDDNASGITATNNIFDLNAGTSNYSDSFEIHGGNNNSISNNIFDLGTSSETSFGLLQADEANEQPQGGFTQLTNDSITDNVYTTEASAPRDPGFANLTNGFGDVSISQNDFWSFAGKALSVSGVGASGDAQPNYQAPAASAATTLAGFERYTDSHGFTPIHT